MLRLDCLRSIYPELENCLVVTIMGAVAAELHSLGHRPNFFYLQHAMGLASSTGLGLALVRGLAELHGGRAWMDSKVGKGSRVHVVLPMPVAAQQRTRQV